MPEGGQEVTDHLMGPLRLGGELADTHPSQLAGECHPGLVPLRRFISEHQLGGDLIDAPNVLSRVRERLCQ